MLRDIIFELIIFAIFINYEKDFKSYNDVDLVDIEINIFDFRFEIVIYRINISNSSRFLIIAIFTIAINIISFIIALIIIITNVIISIITSFLSLRIIKIIKIILILFIVFVLSIIKFIILLIIFNNTSKNYYVEETFDDFILR